MKSFKGYLKEAAPVPAGSPAWTESLSTALFDLPRAGLKDVRIPLSPSIFKRIWPKPIRTTAFHVTDYASVKKLIKMQGKKRSISAFYNMDFDMISYGIRTQGGYVVELEGDVLVASPDDVASAPDKTGRRWIIWSTIVDPVNSHGMGGGSKIAKMETDIEKLLVDLIIKYQKGDYQPKPNVNASWIYLGKETGGKTKSLIIKDYIDGMEKIMKKYSRPLKSIFTDYTKVKIQEPDEDSGDFAQWDEVVVNNFKIKKVHVGQEYAMDFEDEDPLDMYGLPFETWHDDGDLSDYITRVVGAHAK
jgi:hypothetical protein